MDLPRRGVAVLVTACLPWAGLGPAWAAQVQVSRSAGQAREISKTPAALPGLELSLSRWTGAIEPGQREEINRAITAVRDSLVRFPDYPDAAKRRLRELQEKALSGVPAAQAALALLSQAPASLEAQRELLTHRLTPGAFLRLKSAAKLLRGAEHLKAELASLLAAAQDLSLPAAAVEAAQSQLQQAFDRATQRESASAQSNPEAVEPAPPAASPVKAELVAQAQAPPLAPAEVPRAPVKQAVADRSPIHTLLFSASGRYRIEGRRRSVLIRESATLKPLLHLETGPTKRIVLEGGRLFTVGTYAEKNTEPEEAAHALQVWDLQHGVALARFPGTLPIEAFLVEPGGLRAWVVDYAQNLWSWDPRSGLARQRLSLAEKRYQILTLAWAAGKARLLARRLPDESKRLRTVRREREFRRGGRTYHVESTREIEVLESAADFTVHLLNLKGKPLKRFQGHEGKVTAAAISPDGRFLYTASDDKTARQWSLESAAETRRFSGHQDSVLDLLADPLGRWLFTSGPDRTIKAWDATSGRELATLRGHPQDISSLALGPDGQHLYSAGRDGVSLVDWTGLATLQRRAPQIAPVERAGEQPLSPPAPPMAASPELKQNDLPQEAPREEAPAEGKATSYFAAARSEISWKAEVLKIELADDWKISGFMSAFSVIFLIASPVFGALLGTVALGFWAHSLQKLGRLRAAQAYLAAEDEASLARAERLRANGLFDEYIPWVFGTGILGAVALLGAGFFFNSASLPGAAGGVILLSFLVSFIGLGLGALHNQGVLTFEKNNREDIEGLKNGVKAAAQARRDAVKRRVEQLARTP